MENKKKSPAEATYWGGYRCENDRLEVWKGQDYVSEWFGGPVGNAAAGRSSALQGRESPGLPSASLLEKRDPQTWVWQDRVQKVGDLGLKGAFFPVEEEEVMFRMGWAVGLRAMHSSTDALPNAGATHPVISSHGYFLLVGNVKLKPSSISEMSMLWKTVKLPIFLLLQDKKKGLKFPWEVGPCTSPAQHSDLLRGAGQGWPGCGWCCKKLCHQWQK